MGLREWRGLRSPGLPRRSMGRSAARAIVWLRGPRLLPQPSAADQSAGGSERACASSAPGRAPPHLPAPLPREFVKQISLIAQAEEFVEEKSRGNSPPLGHPFPTSPGTWAESERVPPHRCPLPALREAATPTPAGRSCRVSSGHPCRLGDVPCSTSSALGRSRPLSSRPWGQTLSPNTVTPGPAVCPCRLAFSIAWLRPSLEIAFVSHRGQPLTPNPVGLAGVWDKSPGLAAALYQVGPVAAALPRSEDARPGTCPRSH